VKDNVSHALKIVFVGGTKRAVNLFSHIVEKRPEVRIKLAIFMEGYEDEKEFCSELVSLAEGHRIPYIVSDLITEHVTQKTRRAQPDVIIGGGIWRSMIKAEFCQSARYGFIALHGSGLPKYRGWAGINWYILNGEKEYVTRMFQLDDGVDSGPLVATKDGKLLEYKINIDNEKHVGEILEEFYPLHVRAYDNLFDSFLRGDISFIPQDETKASYTCNRGPEDGEIDWTWSTKDIFNFIRAQSRPYPGAFSFFRNQKFHIWRVAVPNPMKRFVGRIPGKIVERHPTGPVDVLTADGVIRLLEISVDGNNVPAISFLTSVREKLGFDARKAFESLLG